MKITVYEDEYGNLYRVSDGLSRGEYWMTVRIRNTGCRGAQHRVVSKKLPLRPTRQEAQRDLEEWAKNKGMRVVGTVGTDAPELAETEG